MYLFCCFSRSTTCPSLSHGSYLAEVIRAALRSLLTADLARPSCDKLVGDGFVAVGAKEGIVLWLFHEPIIASLAEKSSGNLDTGEKHKKE